MSFISANSSSVNVPSSVGLSTCSLLDSGGIVLDVSPSEFLGSCFRFRFFIAFKENELVGEGELTIGHLSGGEKAWTPSKATRSVKANTFNTNF